ncbi:MAG TPA: alcohol dehydrogenase catalytic domain-containing protein, partial [Anaerolineae bacterium]
MRVTHAGICNTDIELTKGYMGFKGVPGHEFVGLIEAGQDDALEQSNFKSGDRVVAEINCVSPASVSRDYFTRAQDPFRTTIGIDRHDG